MNTLLGDDEDEDEDEEDDSGEVSTGAWGSVCGWGFSITEATVACRQLGFASASKFELSFKTG